MSLSLNGPGGGGVIHGKKDLCGGDGKKNWRKIWPKNGLKSPKIAKIWPKNGLKWPKIA